MGFPTSYTSGRNLLRLGATLALGALAVLARADTTPAPQAANAPYSAPIAKLQVTGNMETFSVDADHADAQTVLKAIFDQANAQFTTDNGVRGQVTLRLSDQSLATTLDAVCKQLLIRYQKNAKGIYVFDQDPEAIKATITRIKDQNALLRQQLRSLGVSVPDDASLDNASVAGGLARGVPGTNSQAPGLNGGAGGFGGGGRGGLQLKADAAETNRRAGGSRNSGPAGPAGADGPAGPAGAGANRALANRAVAKDNGVQNSAAAGYSYLTPETLAEIFALNSQTNTLQNPDSYRAFQKENGNVFINTGTRKVPVTEVLLELGRQSNTTILIDSSVPTGPKFAVQGYITPRPLAEALNVLTQSSRLTWRWLGAMVYVEALPDFQLFYNSTSPRVIFGSQSLPTQQNGPQGQQYNSNSGLYYAQPSQIPLPITNGEKKTP